MKKQTILFLVLSALLFYSCSKDGHGPNGIESDDVAYVSLRIKTQVGARSEELTPDPAEDALKSIYLITFDATGVITKVPGTNFYYSEQITSQASPPAFKVSGSSDKLLVIANPGPALKNLLDNGIMSTTTFTSFNKAIASIKVNEVIDNPSNTKGFAMISSGNDKAPATEITDPLVNVGGNIKKLSSYNGVEADAIDAAENDRVRINIERLASRVDFSVKSPLTVKPDGATFALLNWNLDAVNSTYFPFAYKKLLGNTHTGTDYTGSFYTTDPNFSGMPVGQGILKATIDANYAPVFGDEGYTSWLAGGGKTYCVENTMAAQEQKYGNATRVVLKGTYYYATGMTGDWFQFAGINYPSLDALQQAYSDAGTGSNLANACDKMYNHIDDYYTNVLADNLAATDFLDLDESELLLVSNGGEVLKDGKNPVIRWYQDGLCYYYYEIRHNREATGEMAFSKYGVVRNHTYQLNLATVNGPGTPWYPDIDNPGPGDPDPTDPIDEESSYLGIEINVMPWILWAYDIEV